MRDGLQNGAVQVSKGPVTEVARFFGYFETPGGASIRLVLR
jgi:hypothetical protein